MTTATSDNVRRIAVDQYRDHERAPHRLAARLRSTGAETRRGTNADACPRWRASLLSHRVVPFATAVLAMCLVCGGLRAQQERDDETPPDATTQSDADTATPDDPDADARFAPPRGMRPRFGPDRASGPDPRSDGPPPFHRLSDEERGRVEAFIREHFPVMAAELDRVKGQNPRLYERRMARIAPEVHRLMEVFQRDPQQGALMIRERRLDMELRLLSMRFRHANNDTDRQRIRARMHEAASELFDVRHERRAGEIRTLESRILELRERHEQAARMRGQIIEREIRERLERPFPRDEEHE